jgi:hypothetical protein
MRGLEVLLGQICLGCPEAARQAVHERVVHVGDGHGAVVEPQGGRQHLSIVAAVIGGVL